MESKNFKFINNGFQKLESLPKRNCDSLRLSAIKNIDFNNLFLKEGEFHSQENVHAVNPRPGRNLAEKMDTDFIFSNPTLITSLTSILGQKWRVLEYKFVVGVPKLMIPDWVLDHSKNAPIPNLGMYINPIQRNCTYFRGIDFHQDIIDYPGRKPDFITLYIYLDNVSANKSPLIILPDSHKFGATVFPHKILKSKDQLVYYPKTNTSTSLDPIIVTGKSGDVNIWHPFIIHGTKPIESKEPRISLRMILDKNSHIDKECILDKTNYDIKGEKWLRKMRKDLNKSGFNRLKNNFLAGMF